MNNEQKENLRWLLSVTPVQLYKQDISRRFHNLTQRINWRQRSSLYLAQEKVFESMFHVIDEDVIVRFTFHVIPNEQVKFEDGYIGEETKIIDSDNKFTWEIRLRGPVMSHTMNYRIRKKIFYTAFPMELRGEIQKQISKVTYEVIAVRPETITNIDINGQTGVIKTNPVIKQGRVQFIRKTTQPPRKQDHLIEEVEIKYDGKPSGMKHYMTRNKAMCIPYIKAVLSREFNEFKKKSPVTTPFKQLIMQRRNRIVEYIQHCFNIEDNYDYDVNSVYCLSKVLPFEAFVETASTILRMNDFNERHLLLQSIENVSRGMEYYIEGYESTKAFGSNRITRHKIQIRKFIKLTHFKKWFINGINLNTLSTICKVYSQLQAAGHDRYNRLKDVHLKDVKKILHSKTSREFIYKATAFVNEYKSKEMKELERLMPKEFAAIIQQHGLHRDPHDIVIALKELPLQMKEGKLKGQFEPMRIVIPPPAELIMYELKKLLGVRSQGIKGTAANPGKLFFELMKRKLYPNINIARVAEYNELIVSHAGDPIDEYIFTIPDKNDFINLIPGEVFNNCMGIGYDNKINTYCEDPGFGQFNGYIGTKWVSNSVLWLGEEPGTKAKHLIVDNIEGTNTIRHVARYTFTILEALKTVAQKHQCQHVLIGTRYNDVPVKLPIKEMTIKPIGLKTKRVYSDAFPTLSYGERSTLTSEVMIL